MIRHWTESYIGIPHCDDDKQTIGTHCWGLVRLIYRNTLGIELPSYEEGMKVQYNPVELNKFVIKACSSDLKKVDILSEFDILIFRSGEYDSHVGVYVNEEYFLHMPRKASSRLDRLNDPISTWKSRLIGGYQWAQKS